MRHFCSIFRQYPSWFDELTLKYMFQMCFNFNDYHLLRRMTHQPRILLMREMLSQMQIKSLMVQLPGMMVQKESVHTFFRNYPSDFLNVKREQNKYKEQNKIKNV